MSRSTLDPALPLTISLTGLSPSPAGLPSSILLRSLVSSAVRTPQCTHCGLGSSHFARRYFGNRFFFLLLRLLRCFSSPGSPPSPIQFPPIQSWIHEVLSCGFPHSDICGSLCICHSPQLFAAYHVFHRLSVPRHPPRALSCLTSSGLLSSYNFVMISFYHNPVSSLLFCLPHLAWCGGSFFLSFLQLRCFFFALDFRLSVFGFQGTAAAFRRSWA